MEACRGLGSSPPLAPKRTGSPLFNAQVRAIDGAPGVAAITGGLVQTADLTTELRLGVADWVLCLEVAEHIPRAFEDKLLANLHNHNRRGRSWIAPPALLSEDRAPPCWTV